MFGFFSIQALIFLLIYAVLIFAFFIGLLRTKNFKPDKEFSAIRVTILVPCRNEEKNIPELAVLLNNQNYPDQFLEIIWIDDHSTDRTHDILADLCICHSNNRLINLTGQTSGKKEALKAGMDYAIGEIILLTDADCRPGKEWVRTMANFFAESGNDLILGPVKIDPVHNWFEQIQKLEFLSLTASSIGAAGIGRPVMAQGPNIAVRAVDYRSIVQDLDGRFVSGDDVFLLQAMKNIPGKKIGYVLNKYAWVNSKPAESPAAFLNQRSRWASKATGFQDPFLIFTALLVFLTNLEILIALAGAFLGWTSISLVLVLLSIKFLADLPLLLSAMIFFHCTKLIFWLIPVQIFYPAYIVLAAIHSQIAPVKWKRG